MVKFAGDLQPKQRIYSSYTSDFRSFTEQFVYLETENHVIDVDIGREKGGRDNWYKLDIKQVLKNFFKFLRTCFILF